jgi:hypothetical protein
MISGQRDIFQVLYHNWVSAFPVKRINEEKELKPEEVFTKLGSSVMLMASIPLVEAYLHGFSDFKRTTTLRH